MTYKIKKKQHFVAQGYLKRFRDSEHNFHVLDLDARVATKTNKVSDTFSSLFFYDFEPVDYPAQTQVVENYLGLIETRTLASVGRLIDAACAGEVAPTANDWARTLLYIAVQYIRTPSFRQQHHETECAFLNDICALVTRLNYGDEVAPPTVSRPPIVSQLQALANPEIQQKFAKAFGELSATFVVNDTGYPFVTSDNPVCAVPMPDGSYAGINADSCWWVPLSPQVALIFFGSNLKRRAPATLARLTQPAHSEIVGWANRIVALNAGREVLCQKGLFYGVPSLDAGVPLARGLTSEVTGWFNPSHLKSTHVTRWRFRVADTPTPLSKFSIPAVGADLFGIGLPGRAASSVT